ncbi:MAG: hypothetical protein LBH25_06130 [Fibromonadaceae bacterium]|jgi:hypothetical protein|nr:hypothetical protein [Fibromonadaceae bacterium]
MRPKIDEWFIERDENAAILDELRKIRIAEYKRKEQLSKRRRDNRAKGIKEKIIRREGRDRIKEKISAMDMAKVEKLIAREYEIVESKERHFKAKHENDDKFGTDLIYKLFDERCRKSSAFKMTDKKYKKFVQIDNFFVETYKLAKAEALAISKMLRKHSKSKPGNPLLKEVDDRFSIDIYLRPVFFDWDRLYNRREDWDWKEKNIDLENKYRFYEALEWAFERYYSTWEYKCDQFWAPQFKEGEKGACTTEKDQDGNNGPLNWALEWISRDSKYYWKHRFHYIMHILAVHTFLTLEDILKIKRINIEFKINFGEISIMNGRATL